MARFIKSEQQRKGKVSIGKNLGRILIVVMEGKSGRVDVSEKAPKTRGGRGVFRGRRRRGKRKERKPRRLPSPRGESFSFRRFNGEN